MAEEAQFKCLRCGATFTLPYMPGAIAERACPQCGSNSVRHIKEPKKQ